MITFATIVTGTLWIGAFAAVPFAAFYEGR
jgi:hypothetical protein